MFTSEGIKLNDNHQVVIFSEDKDPRLFYRPVGDFGEQAFCRNYGGHPRSDVAVLNEQNDLTEVQGLISRLFQRSGDGVTDEVSDAELSLSHRSRYCQTASEKIQWYMSQLERRDNALLQKASADERAKLAADQKAKRDALYASLTNEERDDLRTKKRQKDIDSLID